MANMKERQSGAQLRWLIRRDMDRVMEIDRRSFFPDQWSEEEFILALKRRDCIGTVLDPCNIEDDLYGFMIYELHKDRLKILRMAVHPELRRTGCGAQMVQRLKDKLDQQRRYAIECEIRESNLKAQKFFSGRGFRAVQVLRRHYDETNEDAYLFRYSLPGQPGVTVDGSNRISQYFDEA